MSFSSDEVNFLVYRYLQESGKKKVQLPTPQQNLNVAFLRFPTFCIHVWHRIPYITIQHQWSASPSGSTAEHITKRLAVYRSRDQYWGGWNGTKVGGKFKFN